MTTNGAARAEIRWLLTPDIEPESYVPEDPERSRPFSGARCTGKDWSEVAGKLSRYGHWEFEDYRA